MKRWKTVILLLSASTLLPAQGRPFAAGLFRYAPYGQSLLADMHPNLVRMDALCHSNHAAYDWGQTGKTTRFSTLATLGMNLPLWYGDFGEGTYGLNVTMPVSATIWLDLFEPATSPIINTDYRIAGPAFCFIHRIRKGFARNYSVAWTPFKHESTHIGDELALQHADQQLPLRRVNVSYNYTELAFTLNEAENKVVQNHCFRAGLLLLLSPKQGWYFVAPEDGDATETHPRLSPWEAWLQYQYQSPASKHGFQGIGSMEIRNRAAYGYPDYVYSEEGIARTTHTEKRIFTYNLFIGVRYNSPLYEGYFSHVALGIRLYHGNCPYGQFRNITRYNQAGICLIFE